MGETDRGRASIPSAVRVGGLGRGELLRALREHGVRLNEAAEALLGDGRFPWLGREREVEIDAVSVGGLGFDAGATYAELTARAAESGWVECPLELGPYLRLRFPDQAEGAAGMPAVHGRAPPGSITVASPPLDDDDGTPKGFYLRRVGGVPWLRGYRSWAGHVWSPEDVLVFARRA